MCTASIIVHVAFGMLLAFLFMFIYLKAEAKWIVYVDFLLGSGGTIGGFFFLDSLFSIENNVIRMYSIAGLAIAFVGSTIVFFVILAYVIKGKDKNNILQIRDILLGGATLINEYYQARKKQIDDTLNIASLEKREAAIIKRENSLADQEHSLQQEQEKFETLSIKKPKLKLPENCKKLLTPEFLEAMPAYFDDMVKCVGNINSCTESLLAKSPEEIDLTAIKSYFMSLAAYVCRDIFNEHTKQVRVHFRIYDRIRKGYVKFVAIIGNNPVLQELTFIPYKDDNMIGRSYQCKRALIKSINSAHDYPSKNNRIWVDYMTYTFYGLEIDEKPFLSFGISIKNATRYINILYFLNYFRLDAFLQDNIERVNEYVSIVDILYGGTEHA